MISDTTTTWSEFDVHGRVSFRVTRTAPTVRQLDDMFAPFRTRDLEHHDLTITARQEALHEPSHAEWEYRYTDRAVTIADIDVQIAVDDAGRFHLRGTRELLTSMLPLLDWMLVGRGTAMIHAATFGYKGRGIAMPAWGGVGKTSTIAKLAKVDDTAFMGDDWAFVTREQELLGYPKPMFIKPHHRPIYPHLFLDRRKPMVPSALSKPVARFTTVVHPLVTRYPKVAGFTRRWSPEHMMVRPERALPTMEHVQKLPLDVAVFVERFDGSDCRLDETSVEWMVARFVGNFYAELPQHSRDVITALVSTGIVPAHRLFGEKADVVRDAIGDRPTYVLRVPAAWSADEASDAIVERLLELSEKV